MARPKKEVDVTDQVTEIINPGETMGIVGAAQSAPKKTDKGNMVRLICDPPVTINGQRYEGDVTVPEHVAQTIIPMIQAKRRSDLEIFTGKSYFVRKLSDGTRIVKEGDGDAS